MLEILLNYAELNIAIVTLGVLEKGTGHSIYCTSDFLNHSRGKMFHKTNELYAKLMQIEDALIEIVYRTRIALNNAGVEFELTEQELIYTYEKTFAESIASE